DADLDRPLSGDPVVARKRAGEPGNPVAAPLSDPVRAQRRAVVQHLAVLEPGAAGHVLRAAVHRGGVDVRAAEAADAGPDGEHGKLSPGATSADDDVDDAVDVRLLEPNGTGGVGPLLGSLERLGYRPA